jgi:23S rRNA (guanine2445-N2)-methyltransferase / 23S rRNA (guanine2069-N7)-methyltransferase
LPEFEFVAACAFGLEAIVKRELLAIGIDARITQPGKIQFTGSWSDAARAHLWLRCADRIALLIKQFEAKDFDQLFETTKAIDWSNWLPVDAQFPVVGRSRNSQLTSIPACQRAVKRAIADSLIASYSTSLPETGAVYQVEFALLDDTATLTIDMTGPSLHKRGYRQRAGEAPLKETLAAAMILLSFWTRERPLHDPFCGSGTIPIEAAMIGRNMAPGLNRHFAAEKWPVIDSEIWTQCREQARESMLPDLAERIVGTDIDAEVLKLARHHSEIAGVNESIHWQQMDFVDISSKREYGCLITNPPYGERLEDTKALERLYLSMPGVLQRFPTWSHFILTSYPRFQSSIQKFADRRRKLFNGRIECTYFQFHGPRPPRDVDAESVNEQPEPNEQLEYRQESAALPVFGGLSDKSKHQAELLASRLSKRARHLRRWPTKRGITCFRLYEKDIPEIPLVIDRYEDCLHISEYERPHERDLGEHAAWLELMAKTAASSLDVDRRRVFLKQRIRQRGNDQHEKFDSTRHQKTVTEGGLKFLVNLQDYVDTGLFLDHRITRNMVRDDAAGKRFLNLFGYTGSFSVYAAAGGAVSTTTVDWSRTYLQWASDNMALNGFDQPNHQFIRSDALEFVKEMSGSDLFDLAVVDPPTFSNSKRSEEIWDVQRDHVELLNELLGRMTLGAVVYFSTNFRRFKFDESAINNASIREISKQTVPEDFRNQRIHRCWRIVKDASLK